MAGGRTEADAKEVASDARRGAEEQWRREGWEEFGKQSVTVLAGVYTVRAHFRAVAPPHVHNFGGMWSLSVEDQFYAVMGVVCLVLAVVLRRAAPRVVPWVVGGGAAAFYLLAVAVRLDAAFSGSYWGYVVHPTWMSQLEVAAYSQGAQAPLPARVAYYLLHMRFDFLALGIVTAYVDRRFRPAIAARLRDRGPFLAAFLLVTPLAFAALTGMASPAYTTGWLYLVAGWCYAPLVVIAAHDRMLPTARGLGARVLRYLGDRSYTIYLLHLALMAAGWYVMFTLPQMYDEWAVPAHPGQKPMRPGWVEWVLKPESGRYGLVQAVVLTALLLPFTEVVYRWVELPFIRVGKWLAKKVRIIPADRPAAVPAQAPAPAPAAPPAVAA